MSSWARVILAMDWTAVIRALTTRSWAAMRYCSVAGGCGRRLATVSCLSL